MHSIKYLLVLTVILCFTSCKKDKTEPASNTSYTNGILILNEGLFQHNNSSLSWLDLTTNEVTPDVFLSINNRPLGDTGNDMLLYGNKIYIAVTGSSTVEVLDKNSLINKKQILFNHNGQSQEPRQLAAQNGKVFVTSFDGYVTVIDTSSLQITDRIKVGRNPEGICVSNSSLFVSNSGGLDFGNEDSTVFEIDLNTLTIIDTFVVGKNPGSLISDSYNNIYVILRKESGISTPDLVKINTVNQSITSLGIPATSFSKRDDYLYLSYYDYSSGMSTVSVFDCLNQTIINADFTNNHNFTTLYGVIPYKQNELICIDAMNYTNSGYLTFFNSSGQFTNKFNVGLNPNTILHYE